MQPDATRAAFLNPGSEYSPLPFWFWNDELTEAEITRQMEDFHAKGVEGFVLHPRKGLPHTIPYLSPRYLHFVQHAAQEARRLQMRIVLYDEAQYPSGSAHGMVVKENPAWASRCLLMDVSQESAVPAAEDLIAVCAARVRDDAAQDVTLLSPENGVYRAPGDGRQLLCFREAFSGGTIRGIHEDEDDGEPLAPASADLLNPEAVQAFIRLTHEKYYGALAEYFGTTVIAMFTDEPDIVGRNARPGCKAWTTGFLAEFGSAGDLPALWLDVGDETQRIRRRYRRAINRRMARTYYGQLARWCAAHGIALTGHPAKGWEIGLLAPFQLPGQDVVWRYVAPGEGVTGDESVMGKCSADAARHGGQRRNGNECFGCCGPDGLQWAFTLDDMKWYMDWLFLRGVNLLYPHAFFYSQRDGRGEERPPDVGPNNLWWPQYGQIAAYIRRMSWLMTDSVNAARVAVLCEEDRMPWRCCVPLYEQQIEFNYLELSRLPECRVENGALCIREQRYTHLVAGDMPLDAPARALLEEFRRQGGQVDPACFPRDAVITPAAPQLRISHVRKDQLECYLLVNEGEEAVSGLLSLPVSGQAQWWNAWEGSVTPAPADAQGRIPLTLERRESLILAIDPTQPASGAAPAPVLIDKVQPLRCQVWTLTRDGEALSVISDEEGCLPGWETLEGWTDYSGWVAYETTLHLDAPARIDLGDCRCMTRAWCNGEALGWRGWQPHGYDLPAGTHQLRIEVCNTLANRTGTPIPSGLMGPAALIYFQEEKA